MGRTPPRPARRRLVGAAALVAVAGLVGGLALASRTDGPADPDTEPGTEQRTGDGSGSGPTGWYLPSSLPDGWSIASVRVVDPGPATRVRTADDGDEVPCWCESATALGPGRAVVQATTERGVRVDEVVERYGDAANGEDEQVDWVHGRLLTLVDDPGTGGDATRVLLVGDGTRVLRLVGRVADLEAVRAMAVAWIQNGLDTLIGDLTLPEGWSLTSMGSTRPGQRAPFVRVTLDTGTEADASYDLVAPGSRPLLLRAIGRADRSGGAELATVEGRPVVADPGTDLVAGPVDDADVRAQLDAVVRSLAPAKAEAWRDAVEPVPSDEPVHQPSFAAAVFHAATGRPLDGTTVERGPSLGHPSYDDVEGLELSLDVVRDEVVEGAPLGAWVLARNATDRPITLNECNESTVGAGLLPVDDLRAAVPLTMITDCFDTPRTTVPPGATARFSLYDGLRTTTTAGAKGDDQERVEPLAAGTYRAAAVIHSTRGDLRVVDPRPIDVVADPCPDLDAAVDRQVGSAPAAGKEAAVGAGLTFRSIRVADDPGPPDCGRVTAYVTDDLSTIQHLVRG